MPVQKYLALFFALLALVFLSLALRRKSALVARRTHRRIGLIFAIVSAYLLFSSHFLR